MSDVQTVSHIKIELIELSDGYFQLCIGEFYAKLSKEEAIYAILFLFFKKEIHPWLKTKDQHKELESKFTWLKERDYRVGK